VIFNPQNLHLHVSATLSKWDVPVLTSDDVSFFSLFYRFFRQNFALRSPSQVSLFFIALSTIHRFKGKDNSAHFVNNTFLFKVKQHLKLELKFN